MMFEGQELDIPIKGIIRAGADNLCADGAMNEVVGMEYKDGSYVPYGKSFTSVRQPSDVVKIYIHKTSDGDVTVYLTSDKTIYWSIDKQTFNKIDEVSYVSDIKFIGNMLCAATDGAVKYLIFRDGKYSDYQINYAQLPEVSFRVSGGLCGSKNKSAIGLEYTSWFNGEASSADVIKDSVMGALTAVRGELRDKGGLTGYFLVSAAYRLTNGEFVAVQPPMLMCRPFHKNGSKIENLHTGNTDFELTDAGTHTFDTENFPSGDRAMIVSFPYVDVESGKFREVYSRLGFRLHSSSSSLINGSVMYYGTDDDTMLALFENGYRTDTSELLSPIKATDNGSTVTINKTSKVPAPYIPQYACTHIYDTESKGTTTAKNIFTAYIQSNMLQYKIGKDISETNDIASLCIFISQEIDPFEKLDKTYWEECLSNGKDHWRERVICYRGDDSLRRSTAETLFVKFRSKEDIVKEAADIKSLYLVEEVNADDIKAGDWVTIDLEGLLGDTLVTRESLPLTAFSTTAETQDTKLFVYNYRLHEFDYKQKLFGGYLFRDFIHHAGFGQIAEKKLPYTSIDKAQIEVTIKDNNGIAKVVSTDIDTASFRKLLNPMFCYPDSNATKAMIVLHSTKMNACIVKDLELKKHDGLGLAYYIDPNLQPIIMPEELQSLIDIDGSDTIRYYRNGLKVSDVAYPSYFPAQYTYRVGDGQIIGMARLTIALSQDNFGQYPLLIFCTDGIYSMGVDASGNGAYTTISPFSREVCINPKTICEIDGAVLFASSKGLMMATQNNVEEFCPLLNGKVRFSPKAQALGAQINGNSIFHKIINHPQITELSDAVGNKDFIDYLKDKNTTISYVALKNKVIVYNSSSGYVYWIDIPTRNTTKLDMSIAFDDDNYPTEKYYHYQNTDLQVLSFPYDVESGTTALQCMFQTRPIKIQKGLKTAFRVAMSGYFRGDPAYTTTGEKFAELIVLGSLDGEHWMPIGIKEKSLREPFHNFGCVTDRVSCNYIMILFAGKLMGDSHIDSIKITNESKYNNKLKL